MEAKRVDVKLYVQDGARVAPSELIPVFHGWIQRTAIQDELLIDVAGYEHVVDGPGVLLIGHEAQYGYDATKGRTGLLYSQRRAKIDGGFREALAYSVAHALRAAALLEKEQSLAGRLRFSAKELTIRINDRLRAPNTPATFQAVETDVRAVLGPLFGPELQITQAPGTGAAAPWQDELFTLHVRGGGAANVDALLGRLPN